MQQEVRVLSQRGETCACRGVITAEEMGHYEEQYKHIKKILQIYETDPDNFGDLFDALQQVSKLPA